ncbi:hypothetical protein A9R05_42840 (plasmid) [Burkholderia sp. KK1]|nr:hypothetical protein A9R05_42840 [Burkholderia sp. KK1]
MMVYYSVVDEGYDVTIYRSAVAVARFLVSEGVQRLSRNEIAPNSERQSESQITRNLRESDLVHAYAANVSEWKYKVKRHTRVKG